jgi:MFS transporter, NNP family, nitrate/nitrite transporter
MRSHKIEQLGIATVGFFWCFLMWFSTAAFSPSIAATYPLTIKDLGLLASSAIWMAPVGRIVAGWAADRFGAPRTFAAILAGCGLVSIASAFTTSYELLFAERVIVAIAGVSFVVGIQHVAQWFDSHEMGTAEGFYAGTGNVGAGVGALLLPRIFGTDYQSAFLWLGVIALLVAAWYLVRGSAAKTAERRDAARRGGDLRGMVFVWTRYIAIALMLAYAMSFGLEIALNAWLPGYFARGFHNEIAALGFTGVAGLQIAAGTLRGGGIVQRLVVPAVRRLHVRSIPAQRLDAAAFHRQGTALRAAAALARHRAYPDHGVDGRADDRGALRLFAAVGRDADGARHFHLVRHRRHLRSGAAPFPRSPRHCRGLCGRHLDFRRHRLSADLRRSAKTHIGYLYVALYMFVPFILFYFWAARYERRPQEHGFLSRSLAGQQA